MESKAQDKRMLSLRISIVTVGGIAQNSRPDDATHHLAALRPRDEPNISHGSACRMRGLDEDIESSMI